MKSLFLNRTWIINDDILNSLAFERPLKMKYSINATAELVGMLSANQYKILDPIILKNYQKIGSIKISHYSVEQRFLFFNILFEKIFYEKYRIDISKKIAFIDLLPLIDDGILKGDTTELKFTEDFLKKLGLSQ